MELATGWCPNMRTLAGGSVFGSQARIYRGMGALVLLAVLGVATYLGQPLLGDRPNIAILGRAFVRAEHVPIFDLAVKYSRLLKLGDFRQVPEHIVRWVKGWQNLNRFVIDQKKVEFLHMNEVSATANRKVPDPLCKAGVAYLITDNLRRGSSRISDPHGIALMHRSKNLGSIQTSAVLTEPITTFVAGVLPIEFDHDPSTLRIHDSLSALQGCFRSYCRVLGLLSNVVQSNPSDQNAEQSNEYQRPIRDEGLPETLAQRIARLMSGTAIFYLGFWMGWNRSGRYGGLGWKLLALLLVGIGFELLFLDFLERQHQDDSDEQSLHGDKSVTQKYLTSLNYRNTVMHMANVLNTDKQIAVISALAEGSSIRSIERITGVHRDTIMRLGVKVGQGCANLLDAKMRDLPCRRLEFDELWGFVGKKEKHVTVDDGPECGDVWTFCAVDADTKIVPAFKVGKRDAATANAFVQDVANRMNNRVQISTDGLRAYHEAIEKAFGADVDYAQIVKTYGHEETTPNRRYSAPDFVSSEKRAVAGCPDMRLVSTSYVERLNATTRLHMRRLTRLTLAFSKKLENFEAAVALHFAYYNLVKRHGTLRCTPAMAAGIERDFWTVGDLVEAAS